VLKSTILSGVAKAKSSLQDLAIPAKLVSRTPTVHVPGVAPVSTEVVTDISIVLSSYREKEIDGDRIKASDLAGIIFPEDGQPVPESNDLVKYGPNFSTIMRILANNKVMAGEDVALSQVQLRLA